VTLQASSLGQFPVKNLASSGKEVNNSYYKLEEYYKMKSITVSAEKANPMSAMVEIGEEHLLIDESGLETGIDTGPNPYDYILSALGSCTVITLQMYAQRKNWPLERAEVQLEQLKADPENNANPALEKDRRFKIKKKLKLIGNLSSDQIKRLEDISSRCPVQRSLEAGMVIQTVLE